MKDNKLKKLIDFIGLDYKKELLKLSLFFSVPLLIGVLGFIFLKEITFLVIAIILGVIADYVLFSSYQNKRDEIYRNRDDEFINIINYFQTFISNGNGVYKAFSKLLEYSSSWMHEKIEEFLLDIDMDKSVKPFVDFSANFKINVAKNIMLSIYQMIDEGEDEVHLKQFENLFTQVSIKHQDEIKEKKAKSLGNMAIFPMVGAAFITILLSISIISIVGELINGI